MTQNEESQIARPTLLQNSGIAVSLDDMMAGLQNITDHEQPQDYLAILKLSKGGQWNYGKEDNEVAEDSRWRIFPDTFRHGYKDWFGGKPIYSKMYLAGQRTIQAIQLELLSREDALRQFDPELNDDQIATILAAKGKDGCQRTLTYEFDLRCVAGENEGAFVRYSNGSLSGKEAVAKLSALIGGQGALSEYFFPVVQLETTWYKHDKWGRIYKPIFKVVGWENARGEPEQAEPQIRAVSAEPEEVVEPEVVEEAPVLKPNGGRRGRRRN